MDRGSCATADRVRDGETTEEESGETREYLLAMSQFGSKRPTPNVERPISNSELSIEH
jgi:hypothetical protein